MKAFKNIGIFILGGITYFVISAILSSYGIQINIFAR